MELHKTKLMVAKKRFLLCRGQDTIVLKNCVGLQVRKLVLQLEKIRHDSVGICDGFSEDSKVWENFVSVDLELSMPLVDAVTNRIRFGDTDWINCLRGYILQAGSETPTLTPEQLVEWLRATALPCSVKQYPMWGHKESPMQIIRVLADLEIEGMGDLIPKGCIGLVKSDRNATEQMDWGREIFFEPNKVKIACGAAPIYDATLIADYPDYFEEVTIRTF